MTETEARQGTHGDPSRKDAYSTKITLACDTSKIRYNSNSGTVDILDGAIVPPRLARYAKNSGHSMPDGFYGFFGEMAVENLKAEVMCHLKRRDTYCKS